MIRYTDHPLTHGTKKTRSLQRRIRGGKNRGEGEAGPFQVR